MNKNLLPDLMSNKWDAVIPNNTFTTIMHKTNAEDNAALVVDLNGDRENTGKWSCETDNIRGNAHYRFQVSFKMENVPYEHETVRILFSWIDASGEAFFREFAYYSRESQDGWKTVEKRMVSPKGACRFRVDLIVSYEKNAVVTFRDAVMEETDTMPRRAFKAAITYLKKAQTYEQNLSTSLAMIDQAAHEGADIVVFAEMFLHFGRPNKMADIAVPVPGALTEKYGQKARQHGVYLIINVYENDDGRIYNTNIVFGRDGQIIHKYRKTHLPLSEVDDGIRPGHVLDVFGLDFGVCATQICWDHYFPESVREVAMMGAEILFVSTIGYNEHAATFAANNGLYMVIAGINGSQPSRIISPGGELLACIGEDDQDGYAVVEIDLDKAYPMPWIILGPAGGDTKRTNLNSMRPSVYDSWK